MRKALILAAAAMMVSCGGKEKKPEFKAPVVGVGQWAESNIWAVKVDSVQNKITPGMDRYYMLVFAQVKNISGSQQPFSLQDMALVLAVEEQDSAEVKYQIDGIVSQSEMKKHSWPVTTTVEAGKTTSVVLAYSLPAEAKPDRIKVNDGVGPKFAWVNLGQ